MPVLSSRLPWGLSPLRQTAPPVSAPHHLEVKPQELATCHLVPQPRPIKKSTAPRSWDQAQLWYKSRFPALESRGSQVGVHLWRHSRFETSLSNNNNKAHSTAPHPIEVRRRMTCVGVSDYSSHLSGHKSINPPCFAFKFSATEKMGVGTEGPASSTLWSLDSLLIRPRPAQL